MSPKLKRDLKKLEARAYRAAEWSEDVLRRYHQIAPSLKGAEAACLRRLYEWIFAPVTVWPVNVRDALDECLALLENGQPLNDWQRLLASLLPPPPDESVREVVAAHEHDVQGGSYEHLLKTQAKFDQAALDLQDNKEFRRQWESIKAAFDVASLADHKGVLRRTMGAERNLRPDFSASLRRRPDAFFPVFDAFCYRWNLYGMRHDEPLLLKFAVNLTPYGTMVFIPAYWSLDPQRDIDWSAIGNLHRARVPGRQGETLAANKAERRKRAIQLRKLDAEAASLKLRGADRHAFLCKGLGWVLETDPKRLQRLRNEFKDLLPE